MKESKNYYRMEASFKEIIRKICKDNELDYEKVIYENKNEFQIYLDEFEDPDIHLRCKGKNKNGKRCSKCKKDNSDFCSVHYNQQKEKDNDFINSDKMEKSEDSKKSFTSFTSNIQILDAKKKGILPEKIKKISYDSKKYYINKNDWAYEMDQSSEMILSDIPIGRFFSGKLIILKMDEI